MEPTPNRSMPPGTIIPELVYPDLDAAVTWLCRVFGFSERLRIANHRAQLVFGSGAAAASIVAVQQPGLAQPTSASLASAMGMPEAPTLPGQPTHSVMVRVGDVDRHYEQARQHGARIVSPPADYPFGERQYTAEDPTGRRWTFTQSIADVDPGEWGGKWVQR